MKPIIEVTVTDPERGAEWEEIFGTRTLPILFPLPVWTDLNGLGRALVYRLDIDAITPEQRERLKNHLAAKFDQPLDQMDELLLLHGVPLLAHHCRMLTSINLDLWFNDDPTADADLEEASGNWDDGLGESEDFPKVRVFVTCDLCGGVKEDNFVMDENGHTFCDAVCHLRWLRKNS